MLKFRTPLLKFDEKVCLPGPKIITRQSFHERRRVARSGHTANGGAKVNTAVFQALTCFARVLIMLKNGFSDPNQTCSQVMLFWKWREGVGSLLFFFFSQLVMETCVILFVFLLVSPARCRAHTPVILRGCWCRPLCVYEALFPYDLISNKLERWLWSAGGIGAALFLTITFRKPFRMKKKKGSEGEGGGRASRVSGQIIEKAIFATHLVWLDAMKRLILWRGKWWKRLKRRFSLFPLPSRGWV